MGAPRCKTLQFGTPRTVRKVPQKSKLRPSRKIPRNNEEREKRGHWKTKNKYRGDEDEDIPRPCNVEGGNKPEEEGKTHLLRGAYSLSRRIRKGACLYRTGRGTGVSKLPRRSIDWFEEFRTFRLNFYSKEECAKNPVELARSSSEESRRRGQHKKRKGLLQNSGQQGQSRRQSAMTKYSRNNSYRDPEGAGGETTSTPTNNDPQKGDIATKFKLFLKPPPIGALQRSRLDPRVEEHQKKGKIKQRSGGKKDTPRDKLDTTIGAEKNLTAPPTQFWSTRAMVAGGCAWYFTDLTKHVTRLLSTTGDRLESGVLMRIPLQVLLGRIQGVSPNLNGQG
ncbi:hypothetical protein Tco_0200406 [Tanacetum coccineum]